MLILSYKGLYALIYSYIELYSYTLMPDCFSYSSIYLFTFILSYKGLY
nr:MAG TPA: hypothetical protein [Herelleviridae sp.]